jgi:mobilization protein A
MIVKFLPNKGNGSCMATMNYLLGKDRNREHAKILQGNPELTERLADNLDFKNRYTVGVLSFEETDISDTAKREIMADFEKSLLAGLDQDQYNICWIEHRDKDRLELNFVIPNVELTTGKRLQPYYDRADRPLVENWKQVTNHNYNLSDPHDPRKAQAIKIEPHNLPKAVQAIKERIGAVISDQIQKGAIIDRQGVIDLLTQSGFEIARTTDKSISIKNPNGKRNIRLEGIIYENRRFNGELGAERTRTRQDYDRENTERYQSALGKLQRAITVKSESNSKNFKRPASEHTTGLKKHGDNQDHDRGGSRLAGSVYAGAKPSQYLAIQKTSADGRTAGTDRAEHQAKPSTSPSTSQDGYRAEQRWYDLDTAQKPQEFRSWNGQHEQKTANLFEVNSHAKRLHERLQRLTERVGTAVKRLTGDHSNTERADTAINGSQSVFENAERAITGANRQINDTERQIKQREQQANELIAEQQKALDRGKGFGFGR